MAVQIGLSDTSSGSPFLDISPRASNVVIITGEHGFGTLTAFVKMGLWEAFLLYDRPGLPHVQVTEFGSVWEGRLEDVKIVTGGVQLTALGYWRSLSDAPYTALWSYSRVSEWQMLTIDNRSDAYCERYVMDNNNRLYMTPSKNATLGNTGSNKSALWGYKPPDQGNRQIVAATFDYAFLAPANWQAFLRGHNTVWGIVSTLMTLNGSGALQSGTQTLTFSVVDRLAFHLLFNAADAAYAPETGANYLKITNLRVWTTTSVSLYADEIAKDLVATVNAANPTQLSATTSLISSPGVDLHVAPYQDKLPADILDTLAKLGDSASPPNLYETGVWENQLLSYQKRGATARTWYVDISDLQLERTINALYNSVYATYTDTLNYTLRTPTNTDADSIARYGLTRTRQVQTQTTTSAQANTQRDAALQDGKDPQPRITIKFDRLYDAAGSIYPLWMARAWDLCVIRNLPLTLSASLDRIRTMRVIATSYDVDHDVLTVTPEQYPPQLDVITARLAAGLRQ